MWDLIKLTKAAISGLTPNEFMTVFPIEKRYDGDRYEVKDYFSTMKELREIGMDTVIGGHVDSLLFDYQNPHVRKFNVFKFNVVDPFRAYQGKQSLILEFMAEKGVRPVTSAPQPLWQTIIAGNLPMTVSDKYVSRWPSSSLCI